MKKMIIAVAAVIAGICSNAATVEWDVDTVYDYTGTGDTATGYLVYFMDSSAVTVADANSKLASGDFTFLSKGYQADDLLDDGYASGSTASVYGNSQTINGYLIVLNADTAADATFAYVSGLESGATTSIGGNASISFGDLDGSATAANWTKITSQSVPEPTSGLLLLLGMAGLALRRKQA